MKRMNKKINGKIVAVLLAALMVFGVVAGTRALLERPSATEIGKFDPVFYAQMYPDVAAVLGTDAEVLYNHYITSGQKEGRIPYAGAVAGETVEGIVGVEVTPVTDTTVTAPATTAVATHSLEEARQLWYAGLPHGYQPDYSQFRYTADQMAMLAQKQAEFDAGGYVHVGWTEEQVYARLMELKEQYPEGTRVGICSAGVGRICSGLYGAAINFNCSWDMDAEEEYYPQELFPNGYVSYMSANKTGPATRSTTLVGGLENRIRVGDIIYTTNETRTGHVAVILSHDNRGITVVESNWDGDEAMHWGRFISWNELYNGRNSNGVGKCNRIEHYLY